MMESGGGEETTGEIKIRLARSGDAVGVARVHVDAWKEAYAHILPVEDLIARGDRGFSYELREELWHRVLGAEHHTYVAEVNGQVTGFASGGKNRHADVPFDGELYAIYVHPDWYGQGVGVGLLRGVAKFMASEGYQSMAVFYFRDNFRAKAFYAKHGAQFCCESEYEIDGVKYPDECSVWMSVAGLVEKLGEGG